MDSFYEGLDEIFGDSNSTIKTYLAGEYYNNNVLQKEYFPYQFDSWANDRKFGLVNSNNDAVFPAPAGLTAYTNNAGVIQTNLSFVVDAFVEMKKYHASLLTGQKFNKGNLSVYNIPEAVETTPDLDAIFGDYLERIYKFFKIFINNPGVKAFYTNKQIFDFNSFINYLSMFFKFLLQKSVINRSSFILSNFCDPNISGIQISIAKKNRFNDYKEKTNSFINDPNFTIFLDSAKRYGFYVDKNIPWRLVADLGSQVMLTYARPYGINSVDDVHKKFYYVAYKSDIEVLKNVIVTMWNAYAQEFSLNTKAIDSGGCLQYFTETKITQQISVDMFDRYFSKEFLLRFYFYTKILETKAQINQKMFDNFNFEIAKLNNYYGQEAAVSFINSKLQQYSIKNAIDKSQLTDSSILDKLSAQFKNKTFLPNINF